MTLTKKSPKLKHASKNTLSAYKPEGHKNKSATSEPQKAVVDEMDTVDIARYIEQEHNADSDVDLFS